MGLRALRKISSHLHSWPPAGRKQGRKSILRAQAAAQGTPVPKDSMLVVGSTGTLGRQVVRKALDAGYDVRCTVRPRQTPADFLRDWGATTVQVFVSTCCRSILANYSGLCTICQAGQAVFCNVLPALQ